MHELAVCQALMDQIGAIAQERAMRVSRVHVAIGPLAGIESHLLRQAFSIASAGTVADGSTLQIEDIAVRVRCRRCGTEGAADVNRLICGSCGDWHTELVQGDEMMLMRVELEDTPDRGIQQEHAHV